VRDQIHAENLRCDFFRLFRRFGELHAAPFAAAAGVNLRLHHDDIGSQFFRRTLCLVRRVRNYPARDRDSEFLQEFLSLIFMNFH
jgi:hypothetical protein